MERSTVASLLRSTQAYCSQICQTQVLTCGIAYYSERFAKLSQANQFREVVVEDPSKLNEAFGEAERWFQQHGLFCYRWAPAGGQPGHELTAFLEARGFRRRTYTVMALTKWVDIEPADDVRVLPARAMRAALRNTFFDPQTEWKLDPAMPPALRELSADACEERLDDPQFDLLVALVDGRPAGRCALYQVGDIARVMDLHVPGAMVQRSAAVQRALTAHVLALAKRLVMRIVCLEIDDDDAEGLAWFEHVGFVVDGTIVEFERNLP